VHAAEGPRRVDRAVSSPLSQSPDLLRSHLINSNFLLCKSGEGSDGAWRGRAGRGWARGREGGLSRAKGIN